MRPKVISQNNMDIDLTENDIDKYMDVLDS